MLAIATGVFFVINQTCLPFFTVGTRYTFTVCHFRTYVQYVHSFCRYNCIGYNSSFCPPAGGLVVITVPTISGFTQPTEISRKCLRIAITMTVKHHLVEFFLQ